MRYEVVRGYMMREGTILTKGSSFDADEGEVKTELRKGIIIPAMKQTAGKTKEEAENSE